MKQRFFGNPESRLFGVYHSPRGNRSRSRRAVLICPPIGQEYNRTHWTLRLLAGQLARKGIHVLRMDYRGIGDSAGTAEQVDTLETWRWNIEQAIEHLQDTTGAETVMLLGQRMGGTLAAQVAERTAKVNSVVLWEPIIHGKNYLNELRVMHAQMLDLWFCKMETPNNESVEELLGSRYHRSLLNEIEELNLQVGSVIQPQLIVELDSTRRDLFHPEPSLQKIIYDSREGSWNDFHQLETAYLRPAVLQQLVKLVNHMFERLGRFGVLESRQQMHGGASQ